MAPPVASKTQIVKQLTTSWPGEVGVTKTWDGPTVTFTIDGDAPLFPLAEKLGVTGMTANERALARLGFQQWNELSNLHLQEAATGGDITFNYSTGVPDYALGETFDSTAFNPFDGGNQKLNGATIYMNADSTSAQDSAMKVGSYGFMSYMHEIGHALGLSHPGVYNASDSTAPTYSTDAQYSRDTRQYSIMSYFAEGSDGSGANYGGFHAQTPMVDDIMAIQAKYGANMSTRTGGTTYGFNTNVTGTDAAIYDFNQNSHPVFTIWDAGGTDTINASGFTANQNINLNAGAYSDIGGLKKNIGIAYNVTIENAAGGSGNDTLTGNAVSNNLNGGAGADTLNGGAGFDALIGGLGNDTYILTDANLFGTTRYDSVTEGVNGGIDTIRVQAATGLNASGGQTTLTSYTLDANVENGVVTGSANFALSGNELNNVLTGNAASNTLTGFDGNDSLSGGAGIDTLIGGAGNDTYTLTDAYYNDVIFASAFIDPGSIFSFGPQYDSVQEDAGGGTDTVIVSAANVAASGTKLATTTTSYTLGANIENGTVGGTAAFNLSGNALSNVLTGNAATNTLNGGGGDDRLNGAGGLDSLIGGAGDDTYVLGDSTLQSASTSGSLTLLFAGFDQVTEAADGGTDTVLVGRATVSSGLTVFTATSYTLADNVENGTVTGSLAFNMSGNGLDNRMIGNAAVNTFDGLGGNDILTGGLGADVFSYNSASFGDDVITDFVAGSAGVHDMLSINRLLAADFNAAMADFAQVGTNAVMTLGGNGTITLQNVNVASLTAADFQFV